MQEKMTVLFVDDEERILRSLKMLFRGRYSVLTTTDGNEALNILKENKVHAIVSDQRMPIMPGVELLRLAREVSPNTMRILLTGYSELDAMIGSVNEGEIFRFVSKPWSAENISDTVEKAVEIADKLFSTSQRENTEAKSLIAADDEIRSVLLLDNDDDAYDMVTEALDGLPGSYELHWGRNVDEAFELMASKDIKVILSEVFLKDESITGAIKTLKHEHPEIVALVVTSYRDTMLVQDLINQGQIYRFLPKPLKRGLLARNIDAAFKHQRLLEASPVLKTRHEVEPIKNTQERQLSDRIMGFINRFRRRDPQPSEETP
jgi:serine/threonine-protein kinase